MSELDPEYVWARAISEWQTGQPDAICAEIRALPIPDAAKDFLIALARGEAKRRDGRPPLRDEAEEYELVGHVFAAWDAQKTREKAIATVAEQRGMTEDTLRGIVDKVGDRGFDYRVMWPMVKKLTEARAASNT